MVQTKREMRAITEDTFVGYDTNGGEIRAENLSRWAYHQLDVSKAMYESLKSIMEHFRHNDPNYFKSDWYTDARETIDKAEGLV
ncbi:hypothetical protein LCGC14_2507250 [marine sediment metagenome]|uniref:Uncharacterized protein n=1 Tax=marine sediment metagenome TaxID=412755 RepID=A0A0F9DC07_9ZZZZ